MRLRPGWPLVAIFAFFPAWWLLGFGSFIFLVMAVPMTVHLIRRGRVRVPRGFGLWLLFLVWMLAGAALLWADAPGAVPGGGLSRLLVFGYRASWYLAATIALLYLGNIDEKELSSRRVADLLGLMFVYTVAGGLAGTLIPQVQLTSLVEMALPRGIAQIPFLRDAIHPQIAHIQNFLGFDQPRPVAPFAYANSWGAGYATFLPFFLLSWFRRDAGWRRRLAPFVLAVSLWPVIFSLNRGLWMAILIMGGWVLFRLIAMGRVWILGYVAVGLLAGAVILINSPLEGLLERRLDNPHSNYRRGLLYEQTVDSTLRGSPFLGYGSTRDVPGNLVSMAEGARPGCAGCGAPPLGTQGHIWLLIFATGFVGTALFLAFFAVRFGRHWRQPDPYAIAGCAVLLCFAWLIFVYDLVEVPLYCLLIAVALMWRRELATAAGAASPTRPGGRP